MWPALRWLFCMRRRQDGNTSLNAVQEMIFCRPIWLQWPKTEAKLIFQYNLSHISPNAPFAIDKELHHNPLSRPLIKSSRIFPTEIFIAKTLLPDAKRGDLRRFLPCWNGNLNGTHNATNDFSLKSCVDLASVVPLSQWRMVSLTSLSEVLIIVYFCPTLTLRRLRFTDQHNTSFWS